MSACLSGRVVWNATENKKIKIPNKSLNRKLFLTWLEEERGKGRVQRMLNTVKLITRAFPFD